MSSRDVRIVCPRPKWITSADKPTCRTSCKKTYKSVTRQQRMGEQSRLSTWPDVNVLSSLSGVTKRHVIRDKTPCRLLNHYKCFVGSGCLLLHGLLGIPTAIRKFPLNADKYLPTQKHHIAEHVDFLAYNMRIRSAFIWLTTESSFWVLCRR
jgi:hypothetical protein